ncbi:MAG: permease-like cell division protein FtsX [Sorangiineae bacterium]|nr:permease-like cell division protein FtsX [Polyangiaceae bacterium]MEB2322300.1 permease-like cell division protein FtsX [Sorangiineae bacterium]
MGAVERAWRGGRNDWRLHLLGVFSVAVAFVCLASALLVVVNVDGVRARWTNAGRASVFLKSGAKPGSIADIEKALRATPGVTDVRFVSSDDARREVTGQSSDELFDKLPSEAFPASLEVSLADEAAARRLVDVATQLEKLPAVDSVETYQSWSARLGKVLTGGVSAALVLALVVLGAVVSVVSSTIRLTLERRRLEVEVLKLVGASDGYVRRPFVVEGAAQGALGAALALALLGVLYLIVRSQFDGTLGTLLGVTPSFLPWHVAVPMVALGGVLGALAAYASLRKLLVV